jgi:hypothetical protein
VPSPCWKRVEKDEMHFYKEMRKEEELRRKKKENNFLYSQ